jgi:general secretion pathway protein A
MSKAQDPFAATSDPNLYVPRGATERALAALADAVWHQGGIAALLGPPGVGKSLLLRVLARRAEDALHCIHVPVPTLDPEGITLWVASRLPGGRRLGGTATLLEVARERPLLLLVEDAELLPADSARAIAELHRASAGAIRAVLAVNAELLPAKLSEAFDPDCAQVLLDDGMDRDEAVDYVTRRLAAAGVPQSVAERFDGGTIAQLHEVSGGNPARFNVAARGHMPVAARSLAETPAPHNRAHRRWVSGLSWALGASALTFAVGLLLGFWLRGTSGSEIVEGTRASLGWSPLPVSRAEQQSSSGAAETVAVAAVSNLAIEEETSEAALARRDPEVPTPPATASRPATPPQIVAPPPQSTSSVAAVGAARPGILEDEALDTVAPTPSAPPAPRHGEINERLVAEAPVATAPDGESVETFTARALFAPELPRELTAELSLDADPPAYVEIDGRRFGPTPIRIAGLRPGAHRLVAHFQTGETMARELILSSGSRELMLRGPVRRAPKPAMTLPAAAEDSASGAPGLAQPAP